MNWIEVKISTAQEAVEGIANIFHELGAGGVVIEDPQLIAAYAQRGQWDDHEFSDELLNSKDVRVKGYLPVDNFHLQKLEDLKNELQVLSMRLGGIPLELDTEDVREEDWANSWKAYFKPEKIGKKTVIKPSWEEYTPQKDDLIIEIDPGMAFGTGNHATTALCIRILESYITSGMQVFDVGTGSGILAIQSALLGADTVQALDFDTVAIAAAEENVKINGLDEKVKVSHSDLLAEARGKADVIVANIVADIIIKLIPSVPEKLQEKGIFISSGIITERKDDVLKALAEYSFKVIEIREEKGWVAIVAQTNFTEKSKSIKVGE